MRAHISGEPPEPQHITAGEGPESPQRPGAQLHLLPVDAVMQHRAAAERHQVTASQPDVSKKARCGVIRREYRLEAEIYRHPTHLGAPGPPTEHGAPLEHRHRPACGGKAERGRQTREAAAHHHAILLLRVQFHCVTIPAGGPKTTKGRA